MFNVRYAQRRNTLRKSKDDPRDGWQDLGLGDPSTLWYAKDQDPSLSTFVTRYGFPWSKNEQDGGTLDLSTVTWGSLPTVTLKSAGTNVRVGLRCDQFAPGLVSAKFIYTFAAPIYFPASFSPSVVGYAFNSNNNTNRYYTFWSAVTPSVVVQVNNTNLILLPWAPANSVNNPTLQRRAIVCGTARVNGSNVDMQYMCKTAAGTYITNNFTIVSNTVSTLGFVRFAMGFSGQSSSATAANSSGQSFGGGVGWKGVSATALQMTAICNKWESLYPLS